MSEYPQQFSTEHEALDDDYAGITQAILDYVEGVYETDPSRIERSVHPEVAKRGFFLSHETAEESIMSFSQFIEHTKTYNKDGIFPPDAPKEILIYEILEQIASAKLIAAWGVDYMHLAKYQGHWMIVHVLWQSAEGDVSMPLTTID